MRMVIHPPCDPQRFEKIREAAGPMEVVNCESFDEARAAMPEAEAFFGKLTPELLAVAGKLRWVQSPTASLEHYLFPELVEHPAVLTNMRGLFSDAIADQVFGYILCFSRNLHTYIRRQKQARWEPVGGESGRPQFATGPAKVGPIDRAHPSVAGKTMGVIGLGAIGEEVARRGVCFGMRVVAVDPIREDGPLDVAAIWKPDRLDDLLEQSDYVVICAPHTPETNRLFVRDRIRKMKRSAVLINIGRGVIVDLADLTAALDAGEIAGAALDVYEVEPLPEDHPLWKRDDVILTPHVAGFSPQVAERHLGVLLENVRRFVRGDELMNVADKRKWY